MHIGTPCQSFPMARVPAVRTQASWRGLPDLTQTQSLLANMGHQLVSVLVSGVSHCILQRESLSVKNPERSLLGLHPDVLELLWLSGSVSGPEDYTFITCSDLLPGRVCCSLN